MEVKLNYDNMGWLTQNKDKNSVNNKSKQKLYDLREVPVMCEYEDRECIKCGICKRNTYSKIY